MTSEIDAHGHRLFHINGKTILIRGAGYSFDLLLRSSPERQEAELKYVLLGDPQPRMSGDRVGNHGRRVELGGEGGGYRENVVRPMDLVKCLTSRISQHLRRQPLFLGAG